jgi:hypothetical protein
VEETGIKITKLSESCVIVAMKGKRANLEHEANRWKKRILSNEPIVCEALTFDFYVEYAHRPLANYLASTGTSKVLLQVGAALITDSLRSTASLIHQPATIAAAALHLASKLTGEKLPEGWLSAFQIPITEVMHAALQILDAYPEGFGPRGTLLAVSPEGDANRLSSAESSACTSTSASPAGTNAGPADKKVKLSLSELKRKRQSASSVQSTDNAQP